MVSTMCEHLQKEFMVECVIATMISVVVRFQGTTLLNEYNSLGSLTCGLQTYVQWKILYGIICVV
jgi:hypothetical protein